MRLSKSSWIGEQLFQAVCAEFIERGFQPPTPEVPGGSGAYCMNIIAQYSANLSEQEVLDIVSSAGSNRELPYRQQITE